jgi:hypothetical protein
MDKVRKEATDSDDLEHADAVPDVEEGKDVHPSFWLDSATLPKSAHGSRQVFKKSSGEFYVAAVDNSGKARTSDKSGFKDVASATKWKEDNAGSLPDVEEGGASGAAPMPWQRGDSKPSSAKPSDDPEDIKRRRAEFAAKGPRKKKDLPPKDEALPGAPVTSKHSSADDAKTAAEKHRKSGKQHVSIRRTDGKDEWTVVAEVDDEVDEKAPKMPDPKTDPLMVRSRKDAEGRKINQQYDKDHGLNARSTAAKKRKRASDGKFESSERPQARADKIAALTKTIVQKKRDGEDWETEKKELLQLRSELQKAESAIAEALDEVSLESQRDRFARYKRYTSGQTFRAGRAYEDPNRQSEYPYMGVWDDGIGGFDSAADAKKALKAFPTFRAWDNDQSGIKEAEDLPVKPNADVNSRMANLAGKNMQGSAHSQVTSEEENTDVNEAAYPPPKRQKLATAIGALSLTWYGKSLRDEAAAYMKKAGYSDAEIDAIRNGPEIGLVKANDMAKKRVG